MPREIATLREIAMPRESSAPSEVVAGARDLVELEEWQLQLALREDPIGSNSNTASSVTSTVPSIAELITIEEINKQIAQLPTTICWCFAVKGGNNYHS